MKTLSRNLHYMRPYYYFLLCLGTWMFACQSTIHVDQTEILWDEWGVPHIYAQNDADLYYAMGYAHMHLRGNLMLELYGRARGKGAEYWGKDFLETDVLIHTMGFPEIAEKWTEEQDPTLKNLLEAYVDGLNAYAEAHLNEFEEEKKIVLPFQPEDVNLHALYVVYTSFVGGQELGRVQRWSDKGSNTYAVGSSRSASGHAMLVQNPHLPWFGEYLFTEVHANTPGNNLYGAGLIGIPGIEIGFNEYLGWSHTDNTIDNADTYELELSGDGYLLDGKEKAFERSTKMIQMKGEDGTLISQEIELFRSEHGPVVKKGENKALAIRMVGFDRPNSLLQWFRMGKSQHLVEFEEVLQMAQIPFWNVMYADQEGNIFYLFNGLVPERKRGDWDYWNSLIDGGSSEDIWTSVHPYEDLPKVKNPAQGWLQNSNDPPWTCTYPLVLKAEDYPSYMAPEGLSFRPQQSAQMLHEDESITFEELIEYKLSTEVEMADRILDDLFEAIDQYGGEKTQGAREVLEKWDRNAEKNSTGMLLFSSWADRARLWDDRSFAITDTQDILHSPDGLANPKQAVTILEEVAADILSQAGSLDIPWGDVYRIKYNDIDLPGNGASGYYGVVRVAWSGGADHGINYIGGGDSWVSIIEFGDKVRAKVLLSYGNSSQPNSPHNGDQLQLFSEKKMRDAYFYREDVLNHMVKREVWEQGKFVEKAL